MRLIICFFFLHVNIRLNFYVSTTDFMITCLLSVPSHFLVFTKLQHIIEEISYFISSIVFIKFVLHSTSDEVLGQYFVKLLLQMHSNFT